MKSVDFWNMVGGLTIAGLGIYAILTIFFISLTILLIVGWFVAPICVLLSTRAEGGAKFGWFLITMFFSWPGFAVFLILTQKPSRHFAAEINRVEPSMRH